MPIWGTKLGTPRVVVYGANHPVSALQQRALHRAKTQQRHQADVLDILGALVAGHHDDTATRLLAAIDERPRPSVKTELRLGPFHWRWVRRPAISDHDEKLLTDLGVDIDQLHQDADAAFGAGSLKRERVVKESGAPTRPELPTWEQLSPKWERLALHHGQRDVTVANVAEVVAKLPGVRTLLEGCGGDEDWLIEAAGQN